MPPLDIADCILVKVVKDGVAVFKVTLSPADVACMAGELHLVEEVIKDGEALERLVIEGECLGPGELMVAEDGEVRIKVVEDTEGEFRIIPCALAVEGDLRRAEDGEARRAGELMRLGRKCLTESDPDWESLLLLGEPGDETIT